MQPTECRTVKAQNTNAEVRINNAQGLAILGRCEVQVKCRVVFLLIQQSRENIWPWTYEKRVLYPSTSDLHCNS